MEHLAALLNSINLSVVLEVLHLLYMFSKRSNFLTRLSEDRRDVLLGRLALLAEVSLISIHANVCNSDLQGLLSYRKYQ